MKTMIYTVMFLLPVMAADCAAIEQRLPKEKTMQTTANPLHFTLAGQGGAAWKPREGYFGPQAIFYFSEERWSQDKTLFPFLPGPGDRDILGNIDFSKNTVAVFTYGRLGSTGYAIRLERIENGSDTIKYYLEGIVPGPEEDVGARMSHPFCLVVMDKPDTSKTSLFFINDSLTEFEMHVFR